MVEKGLRKTSKAREFEKVNRKIREHYRMARISRELEDSQGLPFIWC